MKSSRREASRRKEGALDYLVERAVDFGLERDALEGLVGATNDTEPMLTSAVDKAIRANARRWEPGRPGLAWRRLGDREMMGVGVGPRGHGRWARGGQRLLPAGVRNPQVEGMNRALSQASKHPGGVWGDVVGVSP